ncbi:hypothetical protein RRG08_017964 [Elysia crispata]|uniref:Uncharacterized protein n=1 Tax=Elysia crispata TaxID=231223 RepID=A0AAE0ZD55_9GAST|nr:hypothetical protein RRG08_017964 [Elysia crispata]
MIEEISPTQSNLLAHINIKLGFSKQLGAGVAVGLLRLPVVSLGYKGRGFDNGKVPALELDTIDDSWRCPGPILFNNFTYRMIIDTFCYFYFPSVI